jgi:hypothetical protein
MVRINPDVLQTAHCQRDICLCPQPHLAILIAFCCYIMLRTVIYVRCHTIFLRSVHRLPVTAEVFLSSPILVTLMTDAIRPSETSVLTRATRRNIPEDGIFRSHRRENFKCYIIPYFFNKIPYSFVICYSASFTGRDIPLNV